MSLDARQDSSLAVTTNNKNSHKDEAAALVFEESKKQILSDAERVEKSLSGANKNILNEAINKIKNASQISSEALNFLLLELKGLTKQFSNFLSSSEAQSALTTQQNPNDKGEEKPSSSKNSQSATEEEKLTEIKGKNESVIKDITDYISTQHESVQKVQQEIFKDVKSSIEDSIKYREERFGHQDDLQKEAYKLKALEQFQQQLTINKPAALEEFNILSEESKINSNHGQDGQKSAEFSPQEMLKKISKEKIKKMLEEFLKKERAAPEIEINKLTPATMPAGTRATQMLDTSTLYKI